MKHASYRPRFLWITLNSILFSGYAVFDMVSFFWPSVVENGWLILFYAITLLVNSAIVYGLVKRIFGINYLVVMVSLLMAAHLSIFVFYPLGMGLAAIGPSRAFYALYIFIMSKTIDLRLIRYSILAFNLTMICVHVINIFYFTRRGIVALFRHDSLKK